MRRVAFVVVGVVLALSAPASAQQEGLAAECANDVLEALVGLDPNPDPPIPVPLVGFVLWFLSCAPYVPPVAGPALDAMRDDIEILNRYRDDLPDVNKRLRQTACAAWLLIYSDEYDWVRREYGDIALRGLPTPEARLADCNRWVDDAKGR